SMQACCLRTVLLRDAFSSSLLCTPPRPPIPTLFPYTTLFRSSFRLGGQCGRASRWCKCQPALTFCGGFCQIATVILNRANVYMEDRKSTRLNSSHVKISYAVFCLKKKTER